MELDIDFECPECGVAVKATTAQIAAQRTVKCRRGHSIKLEDKGGGVGKAQKSLNDLDRALKNFGK